MIFWDATKETLLGQTESKTKAEIRRQFTTIIGLCFILSAYMDCMRLPINPDGAINNPGPNFP